MAATKAVKRMGKNLSSNLVPPYLVIPTIEPATACPPKRAPKNSNILESKAAQAGGIEREAMGDAATELPS